MKPAQLLLIFISIAIIGCSRKSSDRYEAAAALAESYQLKSVPADLAMTFSAGRASSKHGYIFDIALNPSFSENFTRAAKSLLQAKLYSEDNIYLLKGILNNLAMRCTYLEDESMAKVDCGDDGLPYSATANTVLHTTEGDFIIGTADMSRGNSSESNENASPLVMVVSIADGNVGLSMEDRVSVSGGHIGLLNAVLTLASSIVRVQTEKGTQLAQIKYLIAAKAGTIFRPPNKLENEAGADIRGKAEDDHGPSRAESEVAAALPAFTKDQFRDLIMGKPMAEVRALLGPPSNTNENSDGVTWFYWSDKIRVTDADAGVVVSSSSIIFSRSTNVAVQVDF